MRFRGRNQENAISYRFSLPTPGAVWRKCNFVIIVCFVCLHKVMFFVYWIISLLAQKTLIFENSLILQRKLLNTEDLFMNTIFR